MTHTYAILDISEAAYAEIRAKLEEAGYTHAFHHHEDEPEVIDMHGLALRAEPVARKPLTIYLCDLPTCKGHEREDEACVP